MPCKLAGQWVHCTSSLFLSARIHAPPPAAVMQRRLRATDGGDAEARNNLMLGEGRAAAREEAITLPLDGDMRMLNLGELFPDFPAPTLSEGGLSGRHSGQVGAEGDAGAARNHESCCVPPALCWSR